MRTDSCSPTRDDGEERVTRATAAPAAGPRRGLARALAVLPAIVVVVLLAGFVDLRATARALWSVELVALGAAAAITLADRYVMAYKWNLLLRVRAAGMPNLTAFRIYLAAGFVGYALPSGVGGDVFRGARSALLAHRGSNVSASIVLERVLGLLAILSLSTGCLLWLVLHGRRDLDAVLLVAGGLLAGGLVATLVSMSERLYHAVRRVTARIGRNRVARTLYALHDEYVRMCRGRGTLVVFWLLSMFEQFLQATALVPIVLAMDAPLQLLALLAVVPLNKALLQFNPVPAGVGVAEGATVVALSLAGVPPAQGLAIALVVRAIDLILLVPMGLAYLLDTMHLRRDVARTKPRS
jgi:uncharacterized protein (TIRG00374 family)